MKNIKLLAALTVMLAINSEIRTVHADNFIVSETEVLSGVIDGNVIVKDGGVAILSGATVEGNITVKPGGTLDSSGFSMIYGNINARGALAVALFGDIVAGNVNVRESGGDEGIGFFSCTVFGNLNLRNNDASVIVVSFPGLATGNLVYGNMNVVNNVANVITIADNEIDGNLRCRQNSPAPLVTGNIVNGNLDCDD